MAEPTNTRPIADLALLSDAHSAALVGLDGTIVWACFPRFDSPSVFAALLDPAAGRWRVGPTAEDAAVSRRYIDDSMVLETTFTTPSGRLTVTDCMPFTATEDPHDLGTGAPHAIVRRVECVEGEVEVDVHYEPRPQYGLMVPLLHLIDGGLYSLGGSSCLVLSSSIDLERHPDDVAVATARSVLTAGEVCWFALHHQDGATEPGDTWDDADMTEWFEQTLHEWRAWDGAHRRYDGPYADLVRASGRVLQALIYRPTGAMVAAPTTSLPEDEGGVRNWDYRYSWVRDAALTVEALRVASCTSEASRFFDWIVRTAGGDLRAGQDLQIMYGIGGEHELGERELPHLEGWRGSTPVRVGNGAWNQRQLDVYGELLDALYDLRNDLGDVDDIERRFLHDLADRAAALWQQPDYGLWEIRDEPRHFTHSKLMCWVALERALHMADILDASDDDLRRWKETRDAIREAIETRGWNDRIGAYTQSFGSDELDASVLLMAIEGFHAADHPRMRATIDAIDAELTDPRGLTYRYVGDDGLRGEEATFLLCTFWLAQSLAMAGELERAHEIFQRAADSANDVGLLAEEVDPRTGELRGNFPQAFSHIGLVNAAQAIARASRG